MVLELSDIWDWFIQDSRFSFMSSLFWDQTIILITYNCRVIKTAIVWEWFECQWVSQEVRIDFGIEWHLRLLTVDIWVMLSLFFGQNIVRKLPKQHSWELSDIGSLLLKTQEHCALICRFDVIQSSVWSWFRFWRMSTTQILLCLRLVSSVQFS